MNIKVVLQRNSHNLCNNINFQVLNVLSLDMCLRGMNTGILRDCYWLCTGTSLAFSTFWHVVNQKRSLPSAFCIQRHVCAPNSRGPCNIEVSLLSVDFSLLAKSEKSLSHAIAIHQLCTTASSQSYHSYSCGKCWWL